MLLYLLTLASTFLGFGFLMAFRLATISRNAACNGVVDLIDVGGGAGKILIRTGAQPTNVGDADTGALLGTLIFSATAFGNAGAVNPGEAVAAEITSDTTADNNGEAGHFRIKDFVDAILSDGNCVESPAGGDLVFDNTTIVAGGTIAISAMTVTQPI